MSLVQMWWQLRVRVYDPERSEHLPTIERIEWMWDWSSYAAIVSIRESDLHLHERDTIRKPVSESVYVCGCIWSACLATCQERQPWRWIAALTSFMRTGGKTSASTRALSRSSAKPTDAFITSSLGGIWRLFTSISVLGFSLHVYTSRSEVKSFGKKLRSVTFKLYMHSGQRIT